MNADEVIDHLKREHDSVLNARCREPRDVGHRATFWRLPDQHWICGLCHPSPFPPEMVEAYSIGA